MLQTIILFEFNSSYRGSLFDAEKAQVVVDAISYDYVKGAEIDYTQELIGSSFKISQNPNASSECGCKISFQAK